MKKLLSVILAIILVGVLCLPAAAASEKTVFIVVSGMNSFPLIKEDGTKAYPPETAETVKTVAEILSPVARYFVDKNTDALLDSVLPVVYDLMSVIACNPDGTSAQAVNAQVFTGCAADYPEAFAGGAKDEEGIVRSGMDKFGAENTYFFNYDWRLDPLDHADDLNAFIKNVRAETGCTNLSVAAFSMGGTVVLSYLYKYGSADIDNLVLGSTAFQGTSCVGDLFGGDVALSSSGLVNRLAQLTRNTVGEAFVNYLNDGLTAYGINEKIESFVDALLSDGLDRVYDELLIPVFGYMPGLWALVNGADYENAKAFMLKSASPALVARTDEYQYSVQAKAKDILSGATADTRLYIISQYGMQGLPVSDRCNTSNNDFLIDCEFSSGGATCAPLGKTLGSSYSQAVSDCHNHLSADGQVDASTCMFPEYTWFVRGMGHIDFPYGGGCDLVMYLAASAEQLTVTTAEYPQFVAYDNATKTFTPVEDNEAEIPFFIRILNFFSRIRNFLVNGFSFAC